MKNVYIAMLVLAGVITYGQMANAGDTLDDYYTEYANNVSVLPNVEKRVSEGWNCYPYGDQDVGYFQTKEQYINAYDPIFAQ